MSNKSTKRGHRAQGTYNHAAHAAAWHALAKQINAFRARHKPAGGPNGGQLETSFKSLCTAMGMPESESTVRQMLGAWERKDSEGARIPGPDKIKAASKWLSRAQKLVAAGRE